MRCVLQRVSRASVEVDGETVAEIGSGLLLLVGVGHDDDGETAKWMAAKIASLRIFDDDRGRMERTVKEADGAILCVSQFTLYGNLLKGARPNFAAAATAEVAQRVYEQLCEELSAEGVDVRRGRFGARMIVDLSNDGPVTLTLER